jgi:predicted porin
MKKTLIAMAAVAVAGVASAQVTITGKIGFGVKDSSEMARTVDWTDGGVAFSASEDLGGGLTAAASMAITGMTNHGASSTGDGASLSLSGGFGKIAYASGSSDSDRLGVGSALAISANTVFGGTGNEVAKLEYTLPSMVDGLSVTARMSGAASGSDAFETKGKDIQMRLAYSTGPLGLTYNTIGGAKPATDIGATYDFGIAKVAYAADVTGTYAADAAGKRSEVSVTVPMGDLTVAMSTGTRAASSNGTSKKRASGTEFNVNYALSKRTSINAAYATVTTTGSVKQTANTIKLFHTF